MSGVGKKVMSLSPAYKAFKKLTTPPKMPEVGALPEAPSGTSDEIMGGLMEDERLRANKGRASTLLSGLAGGESNRQYLGGS